MAAVVVVGGGLGGLTAAYRLSRLHPNADIRLLEAVSETGGLLKTESTDNFRIDRGPDSILTEKKEALDLAKEIGLSDQIISPETKNRGAYVVCRGKLERMPTGFSVVGTSNLETLSASPILSAEGIARAMQEPNIPTSSGEEEESLAAFVTRRYGVEVLQRLAQPMAGGIYGAEPERLSMQAALPKYAQLEAESGSLTEALIKRQQDEQQSASGARYGMFFSFKEGMQTLPDRLASLLGDRVRCDAHVTALSKHDDGRWSVTLEGGETIEADALVLALPTWVSAELLANVDPLLSESLRKIEYGNAATATFAWPLSQIGRPLDAFGFVVPSIENLEVMASTWSSVKWAGRAGADHALIRVFLGGAGRQDVLERSDAECIETGFSVLRRFLAIDSEPTLTRLQRWPDAMPRYYLGHLARVDAIEAEVAKFNNLELVSNAFRGVGIPDTILGAELAAKRLSLGD